ncbi:uncharacterized protein N7477_004671 [Penicillium maclennaniae]|uniref:uncharacterized protein n=1 Tax=Penicillium maclennaniae TaxID=1343394 RepID=UPI0025405D5F|nr:uncharacterized protein N7477_004671 [Penicillium maclennaniae]KAJ5674737.1 hypothetical protein N7477_004671 [Penicillium maclennaniae]
MRHLLTRSAFDLRVERPELVHARSGYWCALDLAFSVVLCPENEQAQRVNGHVETSNGNLQEQVLACEQLGPEAVFDFFEKCIELASTDGRKGVLRFILPREEGYLVRTDLLNFRLIDCDHVVDHISDFGAHERIFTPVAATPNSIGGLVELVVGSIGALCVLDGTSLLREEKLRLLDAELEKRISFPWTSKIQPRRKTLVLFEGRPDREYGRQMYTAAVALNIDIVVLDRPGHWIEGPKYAHWRKVFIPIDIMPDTGLTARIVDAVRSYGQPVDGIVCFADPMLVSVAEAAKQLGLSMASPEAFGICTDKYKSRTAAGMPALRVSSVEAVDRIDINDNFRFPLIVKPILGWNSEGTCKVADLQELKAAMQSFNASLRSTSVVIENYCDGPEVNANLIIADGDLVFYEVNDDFPKSGDMALAESHGASNAEVNFLENVTAFPSALPKSEQDMVVRDLHKLLLRIGFTTGVFHMESRIQNSSMEYKVGPNGLLDLSTRQIEDSTNPKPTNFLIEINARPPGPHDSLPCTLAYGIDLPAASILFAVGETERARQLMYPFSGEPQVWYEEWLCAAPHGGDFPIGRCLRRAAGAMS